MTLPKVNDMGCSVKRKMTSDIVRSRSKAAGDHQRGGVWLGVSIRHLRRKPSADILILLASRVSSVGPYGNNGSITGKIS